MVGSKFIDVPAVAITSGYALSLAPIMALVRALYDPAGCVESVVLCERTAAFFPTLLILSAGVPMIVLLAVLAWPFHRRMMVFAGLTPMALAVLLQALVFRVTWGTAMLAPAGAVLLYGLAASILVLVLTDDFFLLAVSGRHRIASL